MNAVHVIGDADTVLAFALGGVPGHVVDSADEARAAIDALNRAAGTARQPILLLITQRMAQLIREDLRALVLDASAPLMLTIPGFGEPLGEARVERFVERILGVRR